MSLGDTDKKLDELFQKCTLRNEEDKAEYERINKEIRKQTEFLWADFLPSTPKYRVLLKEKNKIGLGFLKAVEMMKMFCETAITPSESKITKSLIDALEYLTSIETNGDLAVNMMLLLLAADGDYIHLQPDRDHWYVRHAVGFKDLENPNLPLGTKLDYLSLHGLGFFKKWIKKTLRNRIAHGDFDIDTEGNFFIIEENQDGIKIRRLVDISREVRTFRMYNNAFLSMLMEKTSKFSPTS